MRKIRAAKERSRSLRLSQACLNLLASQSENQQFCFAQRADVCFLDFIPHALILEASKGDICPLWHTLVLGFNSVAAIEIEAAVMAGF
jgi:hypothetical protein